MAEIRSKYPNLFEELRGADGRVDLEKAEAFEAKLKADQEASKDQIVLLGNCMLHCQVCARREIPPDQVVVLTNRINPAGTTQGWIIDDETAPVTCKDHPDRLHWTLVC